MALTGILVWFPNRDLGTSPEPVSIIILRERRDGRISKCEMLREAMPDRKMAKFIRLTG